MLRTSKGKQRVKLTKYAHACVTVESAGATVLLDPGAFNPERAELMRAADAVLITHDHFDHYDADAIGTEIAQRPGLPVYAPESIAGRVDGVTAVWTGDEFTVGAISVRVYVQPHAFIYADQPQTPNAAFLLTADGTSVYHPGDTYFVPDAAVDTLLVPTSGPWTKLGEAVQFVVDVSPRRAIQIHEYLASELGRQVSDKYLDASGGFTNVPFSSLADGASVEL
ncbi:MBL fold metallo-hydrolase [Tsukamurella sp. 8F]|uniref:MBL fold metallo-hydrolase n=1 Tax=unclassified Tsukamurella TaxID=2633480 RepID=UPI0023B9899B|nr:MULTISPECIES: MBL fold metallo-hydrolase [unclassified Tsukamurella]MDF0528337.1 MBL fold metallo-hydrolase [Tsukamurella sp. 8J]MDF0586162.1 MBL fold metallo-hydrolase [Tsukamurella sp. 8F]